MRKQYEPARVFRNLQIAGERNLTGRNLQHDRFRRHLHVLLERRGRDTRMRALLHFLTMLMGPSPLAFA